MPIKPEEALDALKFLGVENSEDMTLDKAKEVIRSKYYTPDEIFTRYATENKEAFNGKVFGAAETKIKKLFEEAGVEFEDGEMKGLMLEDKVKLGTTKLLSKIDTIKADLEKQSGQTIDQRVAEKEAELGRYKSKNADLEKLLKSKADEFSAKEIEFSNKLKGAEINFNKN